MILTEIIVLFAFFSRFSLDRKLADLNEQIEQKQAIIEANLPTEMEIRKVQQNIAEIKTLIETQEKPVNNLTVIKSLLPSDVYFETLEITPTGISADSIAGTIEGFSVFLGNLQAVGKFQAIDIEEIKKEPLRGIVFRFTAKTELPKPKTTPKAATEASGSQGKETL
ncbi:hypothetical protein A2Z33_02330 [Candidatus Gottesmanbacteria bacterium RBG_16_52_11]|uniref:Uncharacterized protein n=1 Tax=Candidatus Gottesmanbacteria bacterium RBG_16_52_11 TaxID=1798374 RepID=A0A1F5YMU3_9BACT|nr:MAG: hypothetical protein A2Z33_02330 [Candidatus Gottesmanbacteria bacterium RBG_16_52_11]